MCPDDAAMGCRDGALLTLVVPFSSPALTETHCVLRWRFPIDERKKNAAADRASHIWQLPPGAGIPHLNRSRRQAGSLFHLRGLLMGFG
jgi:hypothetical protein